VEGWRLCRGVVVGVGVQDSCLRRTAEIRVGAILRLEVYERCVGLVYSVEDAIERREGWKTMEDGG